MFFTFGIIRLLFSTFFIINIAGKDVYFVKDLYCWISNLYSFDIIIMKNVQFVLIFNFLILLTVSWIKGAITPCPVCIMYIIMGYLKTNIQGVGRSLFMPMLFLQSSGGKDLNKSGLLILNDSQKILAYSCLKLCLSVIDIL